MKFSKIALSTLSAATLGFLALGLASTSASAATTTATFTVSAQVANACTISAGNTLDFGPYTGVEIDKSTTISVTCTNGGTYNIGLNGGTTTGGTDLQRKMAGPNTATLLYNLYTASDLATVWGNTSANHWVSGTGTGSAQSITVFGKLPGSQGLTVGSYSDTITATVNY
jgi:spore coat protein U-like protein